MQRFLTKKEELPMATQSQGSNWGQGEGPKLPKVHLQVYVLILKNTHQHLCLSTKAQTYTMITWAWFIISIIMIAMGARYSSQSTDSRSLFCGPEACTFTIKGQIKEDNEEVRFPRANLKSAESVRIRQKKIRETSGMSKKDIRRLGFSYAIKFVRDGR